MTFEVVIPAWLRGHVVHVLWKHRASLNRGPYYNYPSDDIRIDVRMESGRRCWLTLDPDTFAGDRADAPVTRALVTGQLEAQIEATLQQPNADAWRTR